MGSPSAIIANAKDELAYYERRVQVHIQRAAGYRTFVLHGASGSNGFRPCKFAAGTRGGASGMEAGRMPATIKQCSTQQPT